MRCDGGRTRAGTRSRSGAAWYASCRAGCTAQSAGGSQPARTATCPPPLASPGRRRLQTGRTLMPGEVLELSNSWWRQDTCWCSARWWTMIRTSSPIAELAPSVPALTPMSPHRRLWTWHCLRSNAHRPSPQPVRRYERRLCCSCRGCLYGKWHKSQPKQYPSQNVLGLVQEACE